MTDPAYKLEACPFCGSLPYVWQAGPFRQKEQWASCRGHDGSGPPERPHPRLAMPLAVWNARAAPEPPLTEAGREAVVDAAEAVRIARAKIEALPDKMQASPLGLWAALYKAEALLVEAALAHHPAQTPTPDEAAIRAENVRLREALQEISVCLNDGIDIFPDSAAQEDAMHAIIQNALATPDLNQGRAQ